MGRNDGSQLAGFQFQPAEIVNVGMIFYLAYYSRKPKQSLNELKPPVFIIALCSLAILFQPKVAGCDLVDHLSRIMITTVQLPVRYILLVFADCSVLLAPLGGIYLFTRAK